MFKFLHNFIEIPERPAYSKLIDTQFDKVILNSDYILLIDISNLSASIINKTKKGGKIMSMLSEKREALINKSNELIASRTKSIEDKVKAYKAQLEAATPIPEEVAKIQNVIKAIDEVIAYDMASNNVEAKQDNIIVNEAAVIAEPIATVDETATQEAIVDAQHVEGRVGMPTIEIPTRR